ncbi:cyclin N-terminal domain-containing protein 1 [Sebastes umbrosus]|uniref:cyclin N-terminal domain-containing protein 1 n=1 Tax=Sebastes umbrosus TaxID=72105 RepID=UPI00189F9C1B|nr:cyclin N-terminal domain-containing protein 1 [Sebastes umbrosus]XP_037610790.1 cyclin N-terminal domain-containing protein 1 [Sebastes umbrosus]
MAKSFFCSPSHSLKFREASFELLTDFLVNLNKRNKDNLNSLSTCSGNFKEKRLTEHIFLITKELRLDPLAAYHAIELLQRFMVKHLTDLLTTPTPQGAAADQPGSYEDAVFDKLKEKFPLIVFSCVQLASKLSLHSHIIDTNTAVRFLNSVGHNASKHTVLESELMVLKGLEFRLNAPNPLMYVEILLEVLGHNEPSLPVERLHQLCQHVLQFVSLQRTAIYDSLLVTTTQCASPPTEHREKFVTVTEDCMLLGVGVIAVATFILYVRKWEQITGELSHITGISRRSIRDFAHVTLMHIVGTSSSVTPT